MDTVGTGACPHSTSQGTTVDLEYSWTQWPKEPVHSTPQHILRCKYRPVILPDHSGLRWQFTSCGTTVALWHLQTQQPKFSFNTAYPSVTVKVFSTIYTSLGFVCESEHVHTRTCVCVCMTRGEGEGGRAREYAHMWKDAFSCTSGIL